MGASDAVTAYPFSTCSELSIILTIGTLPIWLNYGIFMACKWLIKGYYGTCLVQHTHSRLMSTYLDTSKIQAAGRLSLSPSALRNLKIAAGDSVEIFFDESVKKRVANNRCICYFQYC